MSLTTTAYASRRLIKYGGVLVLGVMFLYWGTTVGIKAWQVAHPPYTPPNSKFGKLPAIIFPNKTFQTKKFNLELPEDTFPEFKDQAKVYVIFRPKSAILALEEDKKVAKSFGFEGDPTEIRPAVYEFKNQTLNLSLVMNVLEGNFTIKYPYENDQMLLKVGEVPTKDKALDMAKNYLTQAKKLPTDLAEGDKKITYWKIDVNGLKLVNSQSEANIARVDFFRKKLDNDLKLFSAEADRATVSVLVSGSTVTEKKIVEVNYRYANIDRESYATYPIISPEEAWKKMEQGNYWPANDTDTENLTIRKVSLGYFEPVNLTNFLEPIYIFEGDNNFIAYVPAITDKWIEK